MRPACSPAPRARCPHPTLSPRLHATTWSQQGWPGPPSSHLYPNLGKEAEALPGVTPGQGQAYLSGTAGVVLGLGGGPEQAGGYGGRPQLQDPTEVRGVGGGTSGGGGRWRVRLLALGQAELLGGPAGGTDRRRAGRSEPSQHQALSASAPPPPRLHFSSEAGAPPPPAQLPQTCPMAAAGSRTRHADSVSPCLSFPISRVWGPDEPVHLPTGGPPHGGAAGRGAGLRLETHPPGAPSRPSPGPQPLPLLPGARLPPMRETCLGLA